jgi:hypothetical protein
MTGGGSLIRVPLARLKDITGEFNPILATANGDPGQTMTVTVRSTNKAFQVEGCGPWRKIR